VNHDGVKLSSLLLNTNWPSSLSADTQTASTPQTHEESYMSKIQFDMAFALVDVGRRSENTSCKFPALNMKPMKFSCLSLLMFTLTNRHISTGWQSDARIVCLLASKYAVALCIFYERSDA
jgi:hypothetical protein